MAEEYYTSRLFDFLARIRVNNNREWFRANREEYDWLRQQWVTDVERLQALMAEWKPELMRQPVKDCFYRFNRDTRFSPDKSPYKTYFSALFSQYGRKSYHASYYLQLGDGNYADGGLFGGSWCTPTPIVRKLRRAIADNREEFTEIISNPELEEFFPGWIGDRLKNVPKEFEADDPLGEFLKMKDIGKMYSCGEDFFLRPDWPERASRLFSLLRPLNDFINYSFDE